MASHIGKRVVEGRSPWKGRRHCAKKSLLTTYTKCVVCQGPAVKQLFKIQEKTAPKLSVVMNCRQDDTYKRIYNDAGNDMWVTDMSPK